MRLTSSQYLPLDPRRYQALAEALGDSPETVISVHSLRRGVCKAYVVGDPSRFDGAVIQWNFLPSEPECFGSDPEILWDLLKSVKGWECVNVISGCAKALGRIIEKEMGVGVRYYGDICYTLSKPVLSFENKAVRQLTLKDLNLLESAPAEVQGYGFGSPRMLLSDGIAACALVSSKIVAVGYTTARTNRHADIGVFTLERWRGRGFATAATSIVARRLQETEQTPVWSTGEDNVASLRIAQKLGFSEVSRSTYVILDKGN